MAAVSSSTSSSLAMSGLASGINWTAIINDMAAAEAAPETQMEAEQTTLGNQNTAYKTMGTDLTTLNSDITKLNAPGFFQSCTAASSDSTVASVTAAAGTPLGTYSFTVSQLATEATQQGATVKAQPISATNDVSGLTLSGAALADPITAGTFTVNGQAITISTGDTLQSIFSKINAGGTVTASYDSTTDKITLSSSSPIMLGSPTDTSNFLQAVQLYTNGTGAITSTSALGAINLDSAASSANLSTAINDGGNGQGAFEINGVTINFDASTDSINDILQSINDSGAGVTATYDGVNHRFDLTNNTTGNIGLSLQDVTGNFLAVTGLLSSAGGALQAGANLQYSIDGSGTLTSQSNTIDASSYGLTGLSITALAKGNTSITVSADTSTISAAITSFVNDYNTVQSYISSQTASTTDSSGTTTPGTLTGDMDAENIATTLRQRVTASPLSGVIQSLNDMGITSNGKDNTLAVSSSALNQALSSNLDQVAQLFTNPTTGLAATLGSYLTDTTGANGVLATKEQSLTSQSTAITNSINTLQQKISNDETEMQNQFVEMEDAINQINVSKEYLTAYFDNNSSTTTSAPVSQNSSSSSSSSSSGSGL